MIRKQTQIRSIKELSHMLSFYFNDILNIKLTEFTIMSFFNPDYIKGSFNDKDFCITFKRDESLEFSISMLENIETSNSKGINYFFDENLEKEKLKELLSKFIPILNLVMLGTEPIVSFVENDLKNKNSNLVIIWDIFSPQKTKNKLKKMYNKSNIRELKNDFAQYSIENLQIWQGGKMKSSTLTQFEVNKIFNELKNFQQKISPTRFF